jgi:predicted DNA binding CopG/RHH family protein
MALAKKTASKADGATVTLNGKEYVVSDLSQEAQQQFINVKIAENEINRIKQQLAIAETAYNVYRRSLIAAIAEKN